MLRDKSDDRSDSSRRGPPARKTKDNELIETVKRKGLGPVTLVALALAIAVGALVASAQPAAAQATPRTASPGTTVIVNFGDATSGVQATPDRFRIHKDSEGTATFANGAQSILCYPGAPCDANTATAGVQLRVSIDDDSPLGEIYVQHITRSGTGVVAVTTEHIITVAAPDPPTAIQVVSGPTPKAISEDDSRGSDITVRLVKANGAGVGGQTLTVTTTRGVFTTDGSGVCAAADAAATGATSGVAACTITTPNDDTATTDVNEAGRGKVTLHGNGFSGVATVTFLLSEPRITRTVDVVLYGDAANMSAAAQNSSIAVGGDTFIVVTILDASGNPVTGAQADLDTRARNGGVTAPETPTSVAAIPVAADNDVDFLHPTDEKKDLPACGNAPAGDNPRTPTTTATPAETDFDPFPTPGTNGDGKCVIQVIATDGGTADITTDDATRGMHTLTIKANALSRDADKVAVEINVGGAPTSITTDAPAQVAQLSSTKITYTVLDDDGVRVGAVSATLDQIEGSGKVTAGESTAMTADGQRSFTYRAPASVGTAVFLVTVPVGDSEISQTIELQIGAAPAQDDADAAPEPPAAPENVNVLLGAEGALTVTTTPAAGEGQTVEQQVQHDGGAWMAVPETAEPGVYFARARFMDGDLMSSWTYSAGSVTVAAPAPEPEPQALSLTLRSGGFIYPVMGPGESVMASDLFGEAITIAWRYNPDSGMWDANYIPGRSGDFTVTAGDILYVNSPIDQTVGG